MDQGMSIKPMPNSFNISRLIFNVPLTSTISHYWTTQPFWYWSSHLGRNRFFQFIGGRYDRLNIRYFRWCVRKLRANEDEVTGYQKILHDRDDLIWWVRGSSRSKYSFRGLISTIVNRSLSILTVVRFYALARGVDRFEAAPFRAQQTIWYRLYHIMIKKLLTVSWTVGPLLIGARIRLWN